MVYTCHVVDCCAPCAGTQVIAPPEWRRRYGVEHGAAFGLSHGLDQLAVFRPSIRDSSVRGSVVLYMSSVLIRMLKLAEGCIFMSVLVDHAAAWKVV